MHICQYCHTENRDDAMYCNHCGAALTTGAPTVSGTVSPNPSTFGTSAAPQPRTSHATGRLPLQSQLRGRYLIFQLVGQGGMAAVYQATNLRTHTTVAIKEMSQDGLTPTELRESLESFRFEASTLQRLRHPNLPRVYESFSENARNYLVMDYIEGKTLEQHQQASGSGPLPEAEVLRWAEQIASVLSYLHSQHPPIIFRDLKPSNIMLATNGQIKLIDFGIARVFAPGRSRDTQVLGTPGFAPPEQYGRAQTDARADVYALGCTLYQLLTGYDPGTTPFNLPPMATRNPKVSAPVQQAIERATRLDRDQRYQSVEAFARDLVGSGSSAQAQGTRRPTARSASGTNSPTTSRSTGTHPVAASPRRGAGVGAAARVSPPTSAAIVVVQPHSIDFGSLISGQRGAQSFTISGQGNVAVRGYIKVLSPWLSLDRDRFDGTSTLVQLVAETSRLPKTGKQMSTLQIDCDRQHLYVPVTLNVLPAPAPATKVVPAVGSGTTKGSKRNQASQGGRARTKANAGTVSSKYNSPLAAVPRRNATLRLLMSLVLALGAVWGVIVFVQRMRLSKLLPVPLTLPVAIGILVFGILLASEAAMVGSGGRVWSGRLQTTLFGATAAAIGLILINGPYSWAGVDVILHDPVNVPSSLIVLTPLAVGIGAAIGAEPNASSWMLAIVAFIGRFPRGFLGLAGAIGCGVACHNLAWPGAGSYAISCVTLVGALIGGILAYRLSGAMRNVARSRP